MSYIGNSPNFLLKGSKAVFEYTATAGQTVFTGGDDNSIILKALDDTIGVFSNGVRLVLTDDYTINTAGDTVTLTSAAALNDIIVIETLDEIANLGTYTKAEADARYINTSGDITTGTIQVSGTNNNIELGTNNKVTFGGTDLEIYSDGTIGQLTGNINVTGNMGIGTSSPASKLHIRTSTNFNYEFEEVSSKLRISALNDARSVNVPLQFAASEFNLISGNVGIGETNPQHKLDIGGMADPTVRIKSSAGGDPTLIFDAAAVNRSARIKFYDNGSIVGGFIDYLHDGDKMNFGSGSSVNPTMTVADQAVGIGTQNPSTKLDVAGTITADQYNTDAALPTIRPTLNCDFANSKTLDDRFTFTRGSTATYYDGKTFVKADENLVNGSNNLSGWSLARATRTTGETAPDGTTTAVRLTQVNTTTYGPLYRGNGTFPLDSEVYTLSIYAKYGTSTYLQLASSEGGVGASFNLSNGTVANTANASATIRSLGDGWYRLSMTQNNPGVAGFYVGNANSNSVGTPPATNGQYSILWGAQVEVRGSASNYTPTTTSEITTYQPKMLTAAVNKPRFDHDPFTGESKGLLIEQSHTNVVPHSTNFLTTSTGNTTLHPNQGIAPDGTNTADGVTAKLGTGGSGYAYGGASNWISNSGSWTLSFYYKRAYGSGSISIGRGGTPGNIYINISSSNQVSVGVGGSMTAVSAHREDIGNGWYRAVATVTSSSSTPGYGEFQAFPPSDSSKYLVWGLQLENQGFASSYIPTSGSSVTRSQDFVSMGEQELNTWYTNPGDNTDNGGTFLYEWKTKGIVGSNDWGLVWRNAYNGNKFGVYEQANGDVYSEFAPSSTEAAVNSGTASSTNYNVLATAFAKNDIASSLNNGTVITDTSCHIPNDTRTFYLGWYTAGNGLSAHVKRFTFWPERLSNDTLQEITKE